MFCPNSRWAVNVVSGFIIQPDGKDASLTTVDCFILAPVALIAATQSISEVMGSAFLMGILIHKARYLIPLATKNSDGCKHDKLE